MDTNTLLDRPVPPCVPAQNVLWFWFDPATARAMHGTVEDAARKLRTLVECDMPLDGLEIFLMPSRLGLHTTWPRDFCRSFANLQFRSVHIGETEHDFLLRPEAAGNLLRLHAFLETLGVTRIILHAHHLEHERKQCWQLLADTLPGTEICVENTGFNNATGHEPAFMEQLCRDLPDCTVCLDIAHVQDFAAYSLSDFIDNPIIRDRIRQIHASWSTFSLRIAGRDVYAEQGYPGYDPYHALYSATQMVPDAQTQALLLQHPAVLEGVVPREDTGLRLLQQEQQLMRTGAVRPPNQAGRQTTHKDGAPDAT